jgi:hypothetical protein
MYTTTITIGWTIHAPAPGSQGHRYADESYTPFRDAWTPGQPQHVETITLELPDVLDHPVAITATDLAEAVFEATNAPEVREGSLAGLVQAAIQATGYTGREAHWSLSVGDTVTVDGDIFACDMSGWRLVGRISRYNQHATIRDGGRA